MKIDLVYLWVDGNDPKWRAEKNKWLRKIKGVSNIPKDTLRVDSRIGREAVVIQQDFSKGQRFPFPFFSNPDKRL